MRQTDIKVMQYIRENARENLTTVARLSGIPVSTIYDKLRFFEKSYITRYAALLNFEKLGFAVRVNIFLRVEPKQRDELRAYLFEHSHINNLYRINNGYDYAAEGIFIDVKQMEDFVDSLEMQFKILNKHIFHIIDDVVREKFLSRKPIMNVDTQTEKAQTERYLETEC